jgi:hypothetical protein
MTTAALRDAPSFAPTSTITRPLPVPLLVSTRSHDASLDAFHAQPVSVETSTPADPPVCGTSLESFASAKRQGAGCCEMVSRVSFSVTTPVRAAAALFSATVTVRVASPCPEDGATFSHGASLALVHSHSRAADTDTEN